MNQIEPVSETMDQDHPLNEIAWRDFVLFAIDQKHFREEFTADTGVRFMPSPTSPIEKMIDQATNVNGQISYKFMLWITEKHWGIDYAPSKIAAEIKSQRMAKR